MPPLMSPGLALILLNIMLMSTTNSFKNKNRNSAYLMDKNKK